MAVKQVSPTLLLVLTLFVSRLHNDYICEFLTFITSIFIGIKNKLFKLFISLECKCNKLQFGIRISSIEVSKQKLCFSMAFNVYNKTYSKEIYPGTRAKGLRVFSSKQWCLSSLPQQESFQKLPCRPGRDAS